MQISSWLTNYGFELNCVESFRTHTSILTIRGLKEKVPKPKKIGKFQNYAAFPETLLVVKKLSCSLGKMLTLHTNARLILIAVAHKQYPRADIREKVPS